MNETAATLYNRGRDALITGDVDGAETLFAACRNEEPESFWPLLGLGSTHFHRRQWAAALDCFDWAMEIVPTQMYARTGLIEALTGRVQALAEMGRDDECLEACAALAGLEPDSLVAAHERVRIGVRRRDRAGILTPLAICLRRNPAHYGALPATRKIVALFDPELAERVASEPEACLAQVEALARDLETDQRLPP